MRYFTKTGLLMFTVAILAGSTITGCASAKLSTDASTSGIRAAEEVGATDVPKAALHLQLAKEELAQAQHLAKEGEKDRAASFLMRAEADAELAVALSRESAEKSEALAAMERVKQLRQDNKLLVE